MAAMPRLQASHRLVPRSLQEHQGRADMEDGPSCQYLQTLFAEAMSPPYHVPAVPGSGLGDRLQGRP